MLTDLQTLYLRAFASGPVSAEEEGRTWTVLIRRQLVKRQGKYVVLTEAGRRYVALHGLDK